MADTHADETVQRRAAPPEAGQAPGQPDPAANGGAAAPAVADLHDRWLRAVAELDNLRKRFERELADRLRAERDRTAVAFLPVLDNLELALRHADADPASIVAGVRAVHEQAVAALAGLGYQRLDRTGLPFDPAHHQAAQVVTGGEARPGSVVAVLRPGYADAQGRLLRPATVAVAGQPTPAGPADAAGQTVHDKVEQDP
jgi:molecular chaperone GrpE